MLCRFAPPVCYTQIQGLAGRMVLLCNRSYPFHPLCLSYLSCVFSLTLIVSDPYAPNYSHRQIILRSPLILVNTRIIVAYLANGSARMLGCGVELFYRAMGGLG